MLGLVTDLIYMACFGLVNKQHVRQNQNHVLYVLQPTTYPPHTIFSDFVYSGTSTVGQHGYFEYGVNPHVQLFTSQMVVQNCQPTGYVTRTVTPDCPYFAVFFSCILPMYCRLECLHTHSGMLGMSVAGNMCDLYNKMMPVFILPVVVHGVHSLWNKGSCHSACGYHDSVLHSRLISLIQST
eukprot:scpid106228/ scgid30580/ 